MRVRITQKLSGSIDGIQLDKFSPGYVYDVGVSLGCYLLAIGAVEPVAEDTPALIWPIDQQMRPDAPHISLSPHAGRPQNVVPFERAEAADRPRRRARKAR